MNNTVRFQTLTLLIEGAKLRGKKREFYGSPLRKNKKLNFINICSQT